MNREYYLKGKLSLSLLTYLYNKYIMVIKDVLNNKPFFPSIIIYTTFQIYVLLNEVIPSFFLFFILQVPTSYNSLASVGAQ